MIKLDLLGRASRGEQEVTGPIMVCDICGKRIEKADQGNILWHSNFTDKDPYAQYPVTWVAAHKNPYGPCTRMWDRDNPRVEGVASCSEGIGEFIVYLINNLGVDMEKERRFAALLSQIS